MHVKLMVEDTDRKKQAFRGVLGLLKYYIKEHSSDNKTFLSALAAITELELRSAWKTTAAPSPSNPIDSTISSFPTKNVLGRWEW